MHFVCLCFLFLSIKDEERGSVYINLRGLTYIFLSESIRDTYGAEGAEAKAEALGFDVHRNRQTSNVRSQEGYGESEPHWTNLLQQIYAV